MVETADLRQRYDLAYAGRLDGARLRRVLAQETIFAKSDLAISSSAAPSPCTSLILLLLITLVNRAQGDRNFALLPDRLHSTRDGWNEDSV